MSRPDVASRLDDLPVVGDWSTGVRGVVALTAVALLARLVLLGDRVAHYDEGRVGYWTAHFLETGQFEYRYIIHGPFVQHVNRVVFGVLGLNEFSLRLVLAVFGGLLPLAVLLFREHLAEEELVAGAFFLALNPVLLYYSRFFRSTLLVAGFALVVVGLVVRLYDTRDPRYLPAAAAVLALAFASKENAAVYVLCWLGAAGLLLDSALFLPGGDRSGLSRARSWLGGVAARARDEHLAADGGAAAEGADGAAASDEGDALAAYLRYAGPYVGWGLLAVVVFLAVSLFFYAPRTPESGTVGFWGAVTNPALLPALVDRTVEDVLTGYGYWFGGAEDPGCRKETLVAGYRCYLERFLGVLGSYALPLVGFAVLGFLGERYAREDTRPLVMFTGYWGFVSVVGYPLGTDIFGAWITVNALVPLVIPAGVGLGLFGRWAFQSIDEDPVVFGAAVFSLLLVVGFVGATAVGAVYVNDAADGNGLVQYAQPADDYRESMRALDGQAAAHEGPDVVLYGDAYVRENARIDGIRPKCSNIVSTLPLQWHFEAYGATADCTNSAETLGEPPAEGGPLLVIVPQREAHELDGRLADYDIRTYRLRSRGAEAVFYYAPGVLNGTAAG